jgi:hypothetical protein
MACESLLTKVSTAFDFASKNMSLGNYLKVKI